MHCYRGQSSARASLEDAEEHTVCLWCGVKEFKKKKGGGFLEKSKQLLEDIKQRRRHARISSNRPLRSSCSEGRFANGGQSEELYLGSANVVAAAFHNQEAINRP